jgi:hypothetical protein
VREKRELARPYRENLASSLWRKPERAASWLIWDMNDERPKFRFGFIY